MKILQTLIPAVFIFTIFYLAFSNRIEEYRDRWKYYYKDGTPAKVTEKWLVPFKTEDRSDTKTIKVVSTFGAHRNSYVKGHKHTGLDLVPKKKEGDYVYIYPMAPGVVVSVHLGHPHKTVVVKHKTSDGKIIYTSYKHMHEYYVSNGQQLNVNTKIGRLYTRQEALSRGGNYDHLHLEIRKKFDDYGCASWMTMNNEELKLRFYDPLKFLKENL